MFLICRGLHGLHETLCSADQGIICGLSREFYRRSREHLRAAVVVDPHAMGAVAPVRAPSGGEGARHAAIGGPANGAIYLLCARAFSFPVERVFVSLRKSRLGA